MAQKPQIIDITKSYLPGDPNSLVQNLVNTDKEDGEEKALPVLPYEGYNFLPTAYGYKSFFGTNSYLDLPALASRAQHILLYQLPNFKNRLIALCEDGIWIGVSDENYSGWAQVVVHSYQSNVFEEWTWCVIENVLYMYKQGGSLVYKTGLGTLELDLTSQIVDSVPEGPGSGGLITDPTVYQTFTVTDGGAGSAVDFGVLETLNIYISYKSGSDYSGRVLVHTMVANATTSVNISVTGVEPVSGVTTRVWIEDVDIAEIYRKDFLSADFPIVLTDFSTMTLDMAAPPAATLYATSTPGTPAIPASFPDIPWPEAKFLNGANNLLGQDAHNTGAFASYLVYLVNDLEITSFAPSFLNMVGQLGIFRAGLRLGFWDSSNSVSWSSNLDLSDFTPSLENLAGNTIFGYIIGRIVLCKGHGEGFVVYSTKSIVGVTFAPSGNLLWDAKKILDSSGIATSKAVTCGSTDDEHFVFSTTGIYTIGKYNSLTGVYDEKNALPELYDYLRESRDPIALKIIQDRYIFFSLYNTDYIYGRQSFYYGTANPLLTDISWYTPSDAAPTGSSTILPDQMWEIIKNEMSGRSPTKRKDGEWIPRYTTTVDIMDDRYYSFWRAWFGEQSTRLPYADYSTYLNTLPMLITGGDITTYLDAQKSGSPDAFRYGILKTVSGIRAGWFMESDSKNNNEALIYGQESEWEAYEKHAIANKERIEAYEGEVTTIDVYSPTLTSSVTGTTAINSVGDTASITWTLKDGLITIATGTATAVSAIDAVYGCKVTYTNWPYWIPVTGDYSDEHTAYTATHAILASIPYALITGVARFTGSGAFTGVHTLYTNGESPLTFTSCIFPLLPLPQSPVTDPVVDTVIGTFITGEGNNLWLTTEGPLEKAAKEIILRRAFNKAFQITKHTQVVHTDVYSYVANMAAAIQYPRGDVVQSYFGETITGLYLTTSSILTSTVSWADLVSRLRALVPSFSRTFITAGLALSYKRSFVAPLVSETEYSAASNYNYSTFVTTPYDPPLTAPKPNMTETNPSLLSVSDTSIVHKTTTSVTTTWYTIDELTGTYGYSQFRALVTHWDRVKFGLYGNYEILETVVAGAMTAKVWDSVYGTDKGTGRDQIWSYADYTAQAVVNLAEGKMSDYDVLPPDPNATPYLTIDGYDQNGITNAHSSFTLPGTTFVLQTGSIEAAYPTYVGALVYDIQLKKWGKYKGDHKVLLETYPINSAENNTITYSDLGSNAAIFDAAGLVYLFDSEPLDSWIRYGKVGFQRLGMTWSGEIKVSMRYASDFRIQVDSSLTGKLLDMGLTQWGNFYNEIEGVLLTDIAARWHSVKISGSYDLTGLEVRGTLAGRR